jgi:hypothetical protein
MFRMVVVWSVFAVLIAAVVTYAVLATPLFLGLRQGIAQNLIADILRRPAVVNGSVAIRLEGGFNVAVDGIKLPPVEKTSLPLPDQFIERIDFRLPYSAIFPGGSSVSKFHLSGVYIVLGDKDGEPDSRATSQSGLDLGVLIRDILNSELAGDLLISNVRVRYRDSADGWDEELRIHQLESRLSADGQFIEIAAAAAIAGTEFQSSGRVQSVRYDSEQNELPFQLRSEIAGAVSRIEGSLDVSGQSATIDADTNLETESVGQLLEDLGLKRTIDGELALQAKLLGSLDSLRASAIQLKAASNSGHLIDVSGGIADISSGNGVDLDFSVAFPDVTTSRTENILDLEVVGFRGHLEGAFEHLSLSETVVRTNVASVELAEIGPISIGRVVKDEDGRLGLHDIQIRNGPADRPTIQIQGRIDDLLGFTSVKLEGGLDLPIRHILGAKPAGDPGQFGRLAGDISLSDADGSFGIDHLNAKVVDSDIWNLSVVFALGAIRHLDEISLDTDLGVPDLKTFAAAVGQTIEATGGLSFAGDVLLRGEALNMAGDAKIIDTEIDGQIKVDAVDGRQQILGNLRSDLVKLPDLAILIRLISVDWPDKIDVEISEEIEKSLRVALDLDFAKITNGKNAAGKMTGRLEYADKIVALTDLSLEYLGGVVSGNISGNFQKDVPAYAAKGRVRKWRMGRLLGELGLSAPISGTVYLDVDLQAQGGNTRARISSASGRLSASLWGGRVPGRLLDLTGLNLVSWLFAKQANADETSIVCAVVPLRLNQGVANGRSMIIETENVQIVGGGEINFVSGALKLSFMPRPKKKQLVDIVTPFGISGTFSNPEVKAQVGKGGRAIAEVVALPLNLIGHLFTGNKSIRETEKPCVLPKNSGPK